jgi:stage V sporulation protein SpoVS
VDNSFGPLTTAQLIDREVARHEIIWVRPDSSVPGIATLIVDKLAIEKRVTLRVIGAGALNQGIKGSIQARQVMAGKGEDLVLRPGFATVMGNDGNEVTAIVLHCTLVS